MAAVAVPLIVAAIPMLKPLITGLVHHVEVLFGHKTGPTKFDQVLKATLNAAQALATAGKIPGQLDPASIAMMIETEVQQLKAAGALTPEASAAVVSGTGAAQSLTLTGTFKSS
jgi:hypothetical protein